MISSGLPVDAALPRIVSALSCARFLVLTADPGAGKSTVVPLALLDAPDLSERKIVMLEPRRIAARAAAVRMASLLGEPVGGTVGFRTRFETAVSERTRVEVVTEAVLTRMLQRDPALEDVSVVVFDEFHERSIHADLGLALALDSRANLREDLAILVMSATLDCSAVAALLGNAEIVSVPGRRFDVAVEYAPAPDRADPWPHAARIASDLLDRCGGDVLVFLPGEREIRETARRLGPVPFLTLSGSLSAKEQDRVFEPHDVPRVILSTPVAETSLTIPSVRGVVDSGLRRAPFFSPATGMDVLRTVRISMASAEQRRGRAGRVGNGICVRLWAECEQRAMPEFSPPEIEQVDLTGLALELAEWNPDRSAVRSMKWMTPPPEVKLDAAFRLLRGLGATDDAGRIAAHGRELRRIPLHPRLAHALLLANERGRARDALRLAAVLSERDPLPQCGTADLERRTALFDSAGKGAEPGTWERLKRTESQLASLLPRRNGKKVASDSEDDAFSAACILAAAFPDRIARRKDEALYVMSNGLSARLRPNDPLRDSEFLVVADCGGASDPPTIFLALPVARAALEDRMPELFRTERVLRWDADSASALAESVRSIGSLVFSRKRVPLSPSDDASSLLLAAIEKRGFSSIPMSERDLRLIQRMRFLNRAGLPDWPDCSEESLLKRLAPHLAGLSRLADLERVSWTAVLAPDMRALDRLAPDRFETPAGSRVRIDYSDPGMPKVRVKLQELFGMKRAPKLADGRISIAFELLSPAMRPVQITSDIDAFWDSSYNLVRKEMRGRYPKHDWPEDPRSATPSRNSLKRRSNA